MFQHILSLSINQSGINIISNLNFLAFFLESKKYVELIKKCVENTFNAKTFMIYGQKPAICWPRNVRPAEPIILPQASHWPGQKPLKFTFEYRLEAEAKNESLAKRNKS